MVDEHEYDHQGKDEEQVIEQQIGKGPGSEFWQPHDEDDGRKVDLPGAG